MFVFAILVVEIFRRPTIWLRRANFDTWSDENTSRNLRPARGSPFVVRRDHRGLVVAGQAGDAGACGDRSRGETGLRIVRAVPERADAVEFDDRHQRGPDRGGSGR